METKIKRGIFDKKYFVDKPILEQLYTNERLSIRDVGTKLNIPSWVIRDRLIEYKIPIRKSGECLDKVRWVHQQESCRKRQSEASKKKWQRPEYREKLKVQNSRPETKQKRSNSAKKMWERLEYRQLHEEILAKPEAREIRRKLSLEYWADPSHIEEQKKVSLERWKNEDYAKLVMKSLHKNPTSYEKRVIELIKVFDLPFIYNANGATIIDGLTPDFVSKKGKFLIEVGSKHWHPQEYDNMRNARFEKWGYGTLFLYDDDVRCDDWQSWCYVRIAQFLGVFN